MMNLLTWPRLPVQRIVIVMIVIVYSHYGVAAGDRIKIILCGDVMLGGQLTGKINDNSPDYPFAQVRDSLKTGDIIFCNLESPVCDIDTSQMVRLSDKKFLFYTPTEHASALLGAGFNVISIANNHIMDWGEFGLSSTLKWCDNHDIAYVGAGENLEKAVTCEVRTIQGMNVGFLAWNMTLPRSFWASDSVAGTSYPWDGVFKKAVEEADVNSDFLIISFHWGKERTRDLREYQRRYAHLAIDYGGDLVVGHHPHVIQEIERYRNSFIFYSLGNFCFGSYSDMATEGFVVSVELYQDRTYRCSVLMVDTNNLKNHFQPKFITSDLLCAAIGSYFKPTIPREIHSDCEPYRMVLYSWIIDE